MAAGPFLVGLVSDSFSLSSAPPVISVIGIVSALFMMIFFRTTHLPKTPG
jgi:xanthosine utilization system XapX-like protein